MAIKIEELKAALAKLNDSDLAEIGLQKSQDSAQESAMDSEAIKKILDAKREQLQLEIELANAVQDGTKRRIAQNKLIKEELLALQQTYKKEIQDAALNESEAAQKKAELQVQLDAIKDKYKLQGVVLEDLGDHVDEYNKKIKEGTEVSNKYERSIDSLGRKMIIFGKGPLVKSVLGIRELGTELANSEEKQKQFRQAMLDTFNVTNFMGNLLNIVADSTMTLVMGLDAASTSLAAATGFGDQFNQTMRNAQQQGNYLGVTMQGAGKAIQGLSAGFTNFVNISGESRAALVAGTAQLERIGVSADTSAGLINFFNQNLGMTAEESLKTTKELAMMGKSLGMTSAQITKDFQSALPTLAVYGDRSQEVFKGLAGAAKVAGVEMNKLLGLAGKFDTFSSAAETTGKLNAILGSQISAVDMLRQTEDERIETLITSMQAQGRSFKDMDRFTQKAIAAAAGIDDLAEAQRIFGMDMGQYKTYQEEMSKSADMQAKFEEAVQKTIPIQEKLKLIMAEFAVAVVPILEMVTGFLDGVLTLYNNLDPGTKDIINGVIVGLGALFMGFKAFSGIKAIIGTIADGFESFRGMLGITTSNVSEAAEEMAEASEQVPEIMENVSEGVATGIERLAEAASSNAKGLAILTLSLIGIAAAVAMMGYAIQGTDFGAFAGLSLLIGTLIVAAVVAGKLAASGVGALVVAAGFALLAGGIASIGFALTAFPVNVLKEVSSIMNALTNLSMDNVVAVGGAFDALGEGLATVSLLMNNLDGKSVKVSSVLENLALLSVGTAKDSMTGAKISASSVNVVSNLENVLNFDGMKAEISIGGQEFKEAVLKVKQA